MHVTSFNFIFIPIVMRMILTLFMSNVSTSIQHHPVRQVFQDSPVHGSWKLCNDLGVQVILDPAHSAWLVASSVPILPITYSLFPVLEGQLS